jgi:hypothetical protein
MELIESTNRGLAAQLGGDMSAWNGDRVMRLPWTVNYPSKKKCDLGRVPVMSRVAIEDDGVCYQPHILHSRYGAASPPPPPLREALPISGDTPLQTPDSLGLDALSSSRAAIERPPGADKSGDALAAARCLIADGYSPAQVIGILLNRVNAVSAHILAQRHPERAARRCVELVCSDTNSRGQMDRDKGKSTCLPYEWAGTLEPQLTDFWLIKNLLPTNGIALVYGHPGSAKTFFALDLAFHVTLGWDWRGRKTKQGLVVYVAAEGARGVRNRIVAFRREHGLSPELPFPLAIVPTPIDMQAPDADTPRLAETIRAACAESGAEPALVIIDTLSKTFGAGKENTDDMATYVGNCGRIASEFDCCVMPVHHRPKDAESDDPRGHSSLRGGADTIIICEAGKPRRARVKKQKDGEEGETFLFDLASVELGLDEDGEAVFSCFVRPIEGAIPAAPDKAGSAMARLTDGQKLAHHWLGEALAEHGHAVPEEIPSHVINRMMISKVVPIEIWRDLYISASGIDAGQVPSDDPGQARDKSRDTQRRTFNRYKDRLQASKIIGIWESYAWLTHGFTSGRDNIGTGSG